MIALYICLIILAAFPLGLTIWRMRRTTFVKKNGVYTDGIVKTIKTIRTPKGGAIDVLTLEYKDRTTGKPYHAKATVGLGEYPVDSRLTVIYLPDKPAMYAIDKTSAGNWMILIFCIILFVFVVFAVWKLEEMRR